MTTTALISIDEIEAARTRLKGVAVLTPVDRSRALSQLCGGEVFIKCENLQRTGSFKIRGAYNRISRLTEAQRAAGVVAASAGNHAQGVALAAALLDVPSTVYMPVGATLPKIEATKRYGADVVLEGKDIGEALDAATNWGNETGKTFVHPFNHPHIIAGQGTIGCEIVEELPDVETVVVPVGGGGLISGIAAAVKARRPQTRVIGVQANGAACFPPSLERGEPVALDNLSTIADGIAANSPGELTFAHVRALVDEMVCVSDDQIAEALVFTAERMKLVLEAAGASGVAAALAHPGLLKPPALVLLSGGNIDPLLLLRVIRFGLTASGRYFAFHTRVPDRPGELYRLLGLVAEVGANVVGVDHHREGAQTHVADVDIALQVETKGADHIAELTRRLADSGYKIDPGT
jgi:threonine dehydratase